MYEDEQKIKSNPEKGHKMTKVGVLTMNRVINYGSILQTYATQRILENLGCECEIIDYRYPNDYHIAHGRKVVPVTITSKIARALGLSSRYRKVRKFHQFSKKYLHLSREYVSPEDIKQDPPLCDVYMAGSDQVWNPKYIFEDMTFLMDFVPEGGEKVSYASSFSTDEIPANVRKDYVRCLGSFAAISVREQNGANVIKNLMGCDVPVVLDPTLLVRPVEWSELSGKKSLAGGGYILVYILTYAVGSMPYLNDIIKAVKKKRNLKTIYLGNKVDGVDCDCFIPGCSPEEFVTLIKNASHVITSSFHGSAFSLNFGVPLTAIISGTNDDRITSLFNRLNIDSLAVKATEKPDKIIFDSLSAEYQNRLDILRKESIDYLERSVVK